MNKGVWDYYANKECSVCGIKSIIVNDKGECWHCYRDRSDKERAEENRKRKKRERIAFIIRNLIFGISIIGMLIFLLWLPSTLPPPTPRATTGQIQGMKVQIGAKGVHYYVITVNNMDFDVNSDQFFSLKVGDSIEITDYSVIRK